jgi:hypothetical protein
MDEKASVARCKMAGKCNIGLVLSGGGARAAYQAGVLLAIARMLPDPDAIPFPSSVAHRQGQSMRWRLLPVPNYRQSVHYLAQMWKTCTFMMFTMPAFLTSSRPFSISAFPLPRVGMAGVIRKAFWIIAVA